MICDLDFLIDYSSSLFQFINPVDNLIVLIYLFFELIYAVCSQLCACKYADQRTCKGKASRYYSIYDCCINDNPSDLIVAIIISHKNYLCLCPSIRVPKATDNTGNYHIHIYQPSYKKHIAISLRLRRCQSEEA